jgi:hypothetical protein
VTAAMAVSARSCAAESPAVDSDPARPSLRQWYGPMPRTGAQALLALSGSADIVEAHVALITAHADLVLTSDPGDIRKLLHARRVSARVQTV